MWFITSLFKRKKKSTLDELDKIENSLKKIEEYRKSTEQKQKRTVANILIYGAALYVLACVIVFVWYLPESWIVRLGLLIPFILVPFIIYGMKRLISAYFNWKMGLANKKYENLHKEKLNIINNVMETETFNKAREILSKYAPEKLGRRGTSPAPPSQSKALVVARTSAPVQIRKRFIENPNIAPSLAVQPIRQMSQPLFPKDRSFTDKLVEYIVGDGPGYRFALICNHCNGHNGMAIQEEFPYVAFNCCYCLKLNPARSQRPLAPPLASLPALTGVSETGNCDAEQNIGKSDSNVNSNHSLLSTSEDNEEIEEKLEDTISTIQQPDVSGESGGSEESQENEDTTSTIQQPYVRGEDLGSGDSEKTASSESVDATSGEAQCTMPQARTDPEAPLSDKEIEFTTSTIQQPDVSGESQGPQHTKKTALENCGSNSDD